MFGLVRSLRHSSAYQSRFPSETVDRIIETKNSTQLKENETLETGHLDDNAGCGTVD